MESHLKYIIISINVKCVLIIFWKKYKINLCDRPNLQIVSCGIKDNYEAFGVGQNNNLVQAVKFRQNTCRIPLVCHSSTNRMMTHITFHKKNINILKTLKIYIYIYLKKKKKKGGSHTTLVSWGGPWATPDGARGFVRPPPSAKRLATPVIPLGWSNTIFTIILLFFTFGLNDQAEHEAILKKRANPDSPITWEEYKSMSFTLNVSNFHNILFSMRLETYKGWNFFTKFFCLLLITGYKWNS
jgi:hypothetical protein